MHRAARAKGTLWVQPHAIETTDGQCWLSGTFNLGKRFTARALCPAGQNQYKMVSFTFDRISENSMRVRQGRKRSRRYQRCSANWKPSVRDQQFAKDFAGPAKKITFNATNRIRFDNGEETFDRHRRSMNLKVDAWGILHDHQDFGYRKKHSKGHIGSVTRDSDGNRVGWLVRDGKLVRMRERHTYFEIFFWPLTDDGKDIICKMRGDQISKKRDGVRRVLSREGRLIDVLSYSWNSETCTRGEEPEAPKEPAQSVSGCNSADPAKAIAGCSAIIASGQGEVSIAHHSRGRAHTKLQQHRKAIDDFSRVIELNPKNGLMIVSSYNERGGAYLKTGQFEKAIKDYSTTLDIHHWQKPVRISKASLYSNQGAALAKNRQFDRAMVDLNRSLKLNPENAHAYFNRGLAFALQDQHSKAIRNYSKALSLNSKLTLAYSQRGDAYAKSGQLKRAIRDYDEALRINPNDTNSRTNRDKALRQLAEDTTSNDAESSDGKAPQHSPVGAVDKKDHCIKPRLFKKPKPKPRGPQFELRLTNTCSEDIVAGAFAQTERGAITVVKKLLGQFGTAKTYSYWSISLNPQEKPAEIIKRMVLWGVPVKAYADACSGGNWRTKSRCLEAVRGGDETLSATQKRNLAEVYHMRSLLDSIGKSPEFAIADLNRAIKLDAKAQYYARRAIAYLSLSAKAGKKLSGASPNRKQAIHDFENALKLNPANKTALYQLSKLGIKTKLATPIALCENGATPSQVIALCTEIVEQTRPDKRILARAYVKRGIGRNNRAQELIDEAFTGTVLDPVTKKAKFKFDKTTRKPLLARATEHKRAALKDFSAAKKADPANPWSYYELGRMWSEQARKNKGSTKERMYKNAISLYLRALKRAPNNRKICISLANVHKKAKFANKPDLKRYCP